MPTANENQRPPWCQDPACQCLTGYGGRICVGRLPAAEAHDDMLNTHHLCLGADILLAINDADAYYLTKCLTAVRRDVEAHGLYHQGRGETYDLKRGKP